MSKEDCTWHTEQNELHYPGQRFQLRQERVLCEHKSRYQTIKVFEHKKYGTVLTLDGSVQCTTFDEFLYQEMLTFLPLCSVYTPSNVLVIGGGDGGIVRELLKDARVDHITLVDIDEEVLEISKKYISSMGAFLESDKVKVVICDASEYVKTCSEIFDMVIIDLTDDDDDVENGPMNFGIFGRGFYSRLKELVQDGGVIAQQSFAPYMNNKLLATEVELFKYAADQLCYGCVPVPSFPNGNIGILFGRVIKNSEKRYKPLNVPVYRISDVKANEMNLKCYYDKYHESSCTLPLGFREWFYNL